MGLRLVALASWSVQGRGGFLRAKAVGVAFTVEVAPEDPMEANGFEDTAGDVPEVIIGGVREPKFCHAGRWALS